MTENPKKGPGTFSGISDEKLASVNEKVPGPFFGGGETKGAEFRRQLLGMQAMTPAIRDAYQKEMDAMLHPPLTLRRKLPGIGLLIILLVCVVGLLRNLVFHPPERLIFVGWLVLTIVFAAAAFLIARSLWRAKFELKPYFSI